MSPQDRGQLFLLVLLLIYFIPAIVAHRRHHRNKLAITVLNALAGWPGVGWIGALVWACTADVDYPSEPLPADFGYLGGRRTEPCGTSSKTFQAVGGALQSCLRPTSPGGSLPRGIG
jgi:hypothetical protein